jgi:hypothetical protein
MLQNSPLLLVRLHERLADRFHWMQYRRPVVRRRQYDPGKAPLHIRGGIALFSTMALLASATAGVTALYVFWIVYQDFSA